MSLLNFIAGNRWQAASQRPEATTAKADVSIHGDLSTPSRHGSLNKLAPTGRKPPTRSQTDSFLRPGVRHSPSQSSLSNPDKRQTAWRSVREVLRSSPAASRSSLLSQETDQEAGLSTSMQSRPDSRTEPLPRLGRNSPRGTSREQEWMEVGGDSSDEDDFLSSHNRGEPLKEVSEDQTRQPARALDASLVMVGESEDNIRRLQEELADTQKKLEDVTEERSALKEQIQALEKEKAERESEKRLAEAVASEEKAELNDVHATELGSTRMKIQELQWSLETMKGELKGKDEKMELLAQENDVLRQDVVALEERSRKEESEFEGMRREVEAAQVALRSAKDKGIASQAESMEEKRKLIDQIDQLWGQLQDLQKLSNQRDQQIQELRDTEEKTRDAFCTVQATVEEKDRVAEDLQHRNASLADDVENLQRRVTEMETEIIEAKNAAQRLLARSREEHRQQLADAEFKIQSLQNEVSSYASIAQELRSSLKIKRAEADKATKLLEERASEIHRLEQRLSDLRETLSTKDQELIDTAASRASRAHLEDTIRSLRDRMTKLEDDHARELHQAQLQATSSINEIKLEASRVESELSLSHEKLRDLQKRYELSEQNRKMLRDQLSRCGDDGRRGQTDAKGNLPTSRIPRDPSAPSDDQAFNLLQTLNYEIFQTAALITDSLCTIAQPLSHDNSIPDLIDPDAKSLIGPHLLSLVRSQSTLSPAMYNPLPLQTALQATLVCCTSRIMTAWYPGHWDLSDFLSATHARIRAAEGITASETWKTTTRARLRPTTATVPPVVDFMNECLVTIFRYAGWSPSGVSAMASKDPVESLLHTNREKLSSLARLSLRLNVILDSIKPQLEPTLVEPGSIFDPRAMEREDIANGDEDSEAVDDEVVCTSEIGLRRVSDDTIPAVGDSRELGRRRGIVLKPKVILRSSFDA